MIINNHPSKKIILQFNFFINFSYKKFFCYNFVIKSQKVKNFQRSYFAWENLRWSFCFCVVVVHFWCVSLFVYVFHFVVVSLFDFQAALLCHRHSALASQTREGLHQLWALPRLLLIASFFLSTASATVLSWHFLPIGIFYLTLLLDIFGTTYFYQGFPGSWQLFLEICRSSYWSLKHRPGPSVCLVHINLQSFIHLKFVFIHVNIAKVLLVVKTLIRSAAMKI